jgi:predicted kinase
MSIGEQVPQILVPRNKKDIGRFLSDVKNHPDYQEVEKRLMNLADDCPGGELTHWSEFQHKTKGRWDAKRQTCHRLIIQSAVFGKRGAPVETKPIAVLLIGTPGSGKTKSGMPYARNLGVDFVVINADDVKEQLPEYEGWNAAALHEESSYVAEDLIYSRAVEGRHHIIFDLTGTNERKMLAMVDDLDELGYEIHVILVKIPDWMAAGRVWTRFSENPLNRDQKSKKGRFVPPDYVYNVVDERPAKTYELLKQHDAVKTWICLSTEKSEVRVLESGKR